MPGICCVTAPLTSGVNTVKFGNFRKKNADLEHCPEKCPPESMSIAAVTFSVTYNSH